MNKVFSDGAKLAILQSIEQELIASMGGDITSPPKQVDIILNNLNPTVESMLIGYDITGFSEVAKVSCRKSLVSILIKANITGGKKIPPSIQFILLYAGSLSAIYNHNKLRKEQIKNALEAPPELEQKEESKPPVLPPGRDPIASIVN